MANRGRLRVGVETNCTAPLALERTWMRAVWMMGVDSLFLPDHYLSFVPRPLWKPEYTPAARLVPDADAYFHPFVMMGMMAARYRRVRIGTGVTEAFRNHPATLAQAFVTLDHVSRGRAILGIGNGERENTEPYGVPFRRRVARLEEALEIIRRLWASGGEPVSFEGRFWRLRNAIFATPLYGNRPPPIWVAAHAPRMLGLTGRYADGWYPTHKLSGEQYAAGLRAIREAAAEAGRELHTFEPALQAQVVLGPDRQKVLQALANVRAAAAMAMLLPGALWARHGLRHPLGDGFEGFPQFVPQEITEERIESAARQVTPELLGDAVFAGRPDQIVAEMRPLVEAGLRHVVLWSIGVLATGANAADMLRLAVLIRRLRRLPTPCVAGDRSEP